MIKHAPYARDEYCYGIQKNNTIEHVILQSGRASYLESCGPNSLENCAAAMIHYDKLQDILSVGPNKEKYQPSDLIFTHMNDPLRHEEYCNILRIERSSWKNRYAIYYPHVAEKLIGIKSEYYDYMDFQKLEDHLEAGNTAQVCLVDPGHYISLVGVDTETGDFYFHDSWPERFQSKNGFFRLLLRDELFNNSHKVMIFYYTPEVR